MAISIAPTTGSNETVASTQTPTQRIEAQKPEDDRVRANTEVKETEQVTAPDPDSNLGQNIDTTA